MAAALTPEQEQIRYSVRRLMEERVASRAAEIDQQGEFPNDVLKLFRDNDIFTTVAPPQYGGLDGSLKTLTIVCEEITRVCANSGMVLGNQYLGAGPVLLFGSEEQKRTYLPRFASGEWLCSFALTEPGAGSDASSLETRARRDRDGWVISGRKNFITHANVADVLTLFAHTDDGITAFLITRENSGWEVDKIELKMGLRGSPTCSIVFDEVRVADDAVIGEVGTGMRIALTALNKGRIMTASLALGIAQGSLELALAYAQQREQFGKAIAEFQGVQFMLADMATEIEASRALVRSAATRYDENETDIVKHSAITKLFVTEMVNRVTSTAVQVLGGYGYIGDYAAERMMRDARVFSIFEGTNQIQRIVIARELMGGR